MRYYYLLLFSLLFVTASASAQSDTVRLVTVVEEVEVAPATASDTAVVLPLVPMADTTAAPLVPMKLIDRHSSTKAYRMLYVSVPLIVGGVVMMAYDKDFGDLRNGHAQSFRHEFDDYLQYAPMMLTYGMKVCGYQSRNKWGRMLVSNAFSAGLMAAAVNGLKYTVRIERPDGSGNNSFPSGHTATAFMAATILHKEYGDRSPWFSILGYAAATATGVARQLNNKHWMSDVMVGAGIGILTTELGYFLADLIFKERGRNFGARPVPLFDRQHHPSFVGINIGFSTIMGAYRPLPGVDVSFATGPTTSIQGAWFASPYIGVGGRVSASRMHLRINNVAQNENFTSSSAALGAYFSYPLSARWLLGSNVLAGYEYHKGLATPYGELGHRGGGLFNTGVSMTFHATESLAMRFTTDYDLVPPMVASGERLHRLTLGMGMSAMF